MCILSCGAGLGAGYNSSFEDRAVLLSVVKIAEVYHIVLSIILLSAVSPPHPRGALAAACHLRRVCCFRSSKLTRGYLLLVGISVLCHFITDLDIKLRQWLS